MCATEIFGCRTAGASPGLQVGALLDDLRLERTPTGLVHQAECPRETGLDRFGGIVPTAISDGGAIWISVQLVSVADDDRVWWALRFNDGRCDR